MNENLISLSLPTLLSCIDAGAAVTVKMRCNSHHTETWCSSGRVGTGKWTLPRINLLLVVYSFMTGLQFDPLKVCVFVFRLFLARAIVGTLLYVSLCQSVSPSVS